MLQRGADEVNDAELDHGLREDSIDRLRQSFETVADEHEHTADSAALQLGEDVLPVFDALAAAPAHRPKTSRWPSQVTAKNT
ncbi:putative transposase [Streptomyces sp. NBRC 110611]|nr:putative transposase [Streptomyces sp. NBRC 110611]